MAPAQPFPAHEPTAFPTGGVAVVIGASGGIGAALVKALNDDGTFVRVIEWHRSSVPPLDLIDEASIVIAAQSLADLDLDIRLVFDATGVLQDHATSPEKSWRQLDAASLAHAYAINAIGPALIMKHLLPRLARSGKSVFATLSARVGSIGDNHLGGWYGYRAAKAGLNQLVRTAAIELRRTHREAVCVALHPGTVATSLSEPHTKAGLDVVEPDVAAARLLSLLKGLTSAQTGGFLDYRGDQIPW